ncbi:hypothetical protein VKT23_015220 [Stygiomarasmius scandens]|uniref:CxC2-like cysteine cluster KDZ transposase-associated domain-containing protein n=1 Tax=Marasmiellus scandens TaxID=2682957 RepID=A0ABR1J0R8_9AGAR
MDRKRFRTSNSNVLSDVTSFSSFGLSVHDPQTDNLIQTQTVSTDGRRIHTSITTAPTQRERIHTEIEPEEDWAGYQYEWLRSLPQEQSTFQVKKGRVTKSKRRRLFASDRPMRTFVHHREDYLAIQMILKGRGDRIPTTCPTCPSNRTPIEPTFRCKDCFSTGLMCQDCTVESHRTNPLHQIELWNGTHFERISLKRLGLVVQLGHPYGGSCPNPVKGPSKMIIVHTNGLHRIQLNYCGCSLSISTLTGCQHQKWEQLMRAAWFPGTHTRPQTACTYQMLTQFHILTLSGKITAYDYYKGLEFLTDNTGHKVPVLAFIFLFALGLIHFPESISYILAGSPAVAKFEDATTWRSWQ